MGNAFVYLILRERHEFEHDELVELGVLTREQADDIAFKQVLPMLLPCLPVYSEETWEAIATWHQEPDRTFDPAGPEYHEAAAERFAFYYGEQDETVQRSLARAEECRRNPSASVSSPNDQVSVAGVEQTKAVRSGQQVSLQTDREGKEGNQRSLIRRILRSD